MSASSKKVIYAALIGNALIAITKFVAADPAVAFKGWHPVTVFVSWGKQGDVGGSR